MPLNRTSKGRSEVQRPCKDASKGLQCVHSVWQAWDTPWYPRASARDQEEGRKELRAIQYKDDDHDYNDSVEYRDETPHATWTNSNLGNFRTQFVEKWDASHLTELQSNWDDDNIDDETSDEKVARLGAKPTSYSSY